MTDRRMLTLAESATDQSCMDINTSILKSIADNDGNYTFKPDGTSRKHVEDFQVVAAKVQKHFDAGYIENLPVVHRCTRYPGDLIDYIVAQGVTDAGRKYLADQGIAA